MLGRRSCNPQTLSQPFRNMFELQVEPDVAQYASGMSTMEHHYSNLTPRSDMFATL